MPDVHPHAWIADTARLLGNAHVGAGASVWFGAVVRADLAEITIGAGSNIQDNAVLHADPGFPLTIGADVTIGHGAICHGCSIDDGVLVGMGAVIMNGAVIGAGSTVAAGAVVAGGLVVPPGSLVAGVPATVRKELSAQAVAANRRNAVDYAALAARHRDGAFPPH